ncbi:hypothetical protein OROMI_005109 [Orobanche minor]
MVWHFFNKLDDPSNIVHKKRVARILFFKIRSFQEILKIHDGTPLESEEILTYIKKPPKQIGMALSSKLYVPNNVVHNKRVAWILCFKIRPSQEILKIRDGTPLEAEEILTHKKSSRNGSVWHFFNKLDDPSNIVQKERVARILFFKIRSFQEILKIHDGTPLESEEILTYIKKPPKQIGMALSSKLYVPNNVVHNKRVAWILCFKIRPSQEILKIRDGTPLEAEEILTHKKSSRNGSVWHFFNKLDDPSNIVQKERVARILFFKIRSFQEILKIHDGTPLESEEILTYIKKPPKQIVQKKRVARILFFKIRPSQEILKIRDGTPLEAEEILTHKKSSRNGSVWHFFNKLDDPSNIVQKERVARILFFKIRSFQEILKIHDGTPLESEEILTYIKKPPKQVEILKIHDGTPLESEEILTYIKKPPKQIGMALSSKLYVPNNVVHNKRVAWILCFKIRPSQEILKIRDGTPLEAEEILTHKKSSRNGSVWHFFNKLDDPSNIVQKERVARILFFKIRSFQEILKIHDGTPLESEEILTYIKSPQNRSVWHFSSKLDVPNNVVQNKRVAWILCFKIRPSQEILKIRDGTPLEAEEILTQKSSRNGSVWHFFNKLDDPSNIVQMEIVARILFFKIRSFQEILKICDGTHLESEEILTYIKKPTKQIEPSQEILKIRDGTPLETEEILTHKKSSRNGSVWHFFNKLDDPSNIVQKERVARILFFKIRSFQEILKIHDGTPLESEEILTYIKKPQKQIDRPSQEILKIRDGTPLEAEEILTHKKSSRNGSVWHFFNKLDDPSNIVQKERVARILFFKIRSFQEILKIHDGTPLESEEILTYIKSPQNRSVWHFSSKLDVPNNVVQNKRVAWILCFKIRPSQEILKIRDGTPLEAEEILTQKKFSKRIDDPSNIVQNKRVARILFFKIRPSQEILKIRDGTPLEAEEILTHKKSSRNGSVWHFFNKLDDPSNIVQKERVARILFFKIRSFQEILKIHDGTPLESEEILTYIKSPQNRSVWHFSSKLDVPNNVVQNKRVAWILCFKIRPSQEILKIRDGTPLEAEEILTQKKFSKRIVQKKRVARILFFKIRPSQEILKIRDGTPLETEEILTHKKSSRNGSVWHFFNKLDDPSNIVQKERVARILFFKIRSFQEILKIHDGTHLESEEILTYIKKPQKQIEPSQEILKIRDGTPLEAEEILTHKKVLETDRPQNRSWPSQEILKIRDGTPLETEEILTHKKSSRNGSNKRVARILFFKIRPSQEILKIRDGTPLEAEEILTHKKSSRNGSVWHFFNKLDDPSNIVQKERVARILFFKIRSFQEILKIHDGTPLESEEILTYIKSPQNRSVWHFSSKLDVPNNVVQNKRVAWILCFKIRPSQEILKIRDGTPLEAEEILTQKSSRNGSVWHFFNKLDDPSNIVQKEIVARILFFKIRSFQEILKICDGTHLESEEILTYIKKPTKQIEPSQEILKIRDGTPLETEEILTHKKSSRNGSVWHFFNKLDDPSNIIQKERVVRILFFKIRSFQEILKIHDGTHLESEEILTYIKKPQKQIAS